MRASGADYFGTWNSDDLYNKDHVKVLVECLVKDPEAGAAFDNVEYFADGSGSLGWGSNLIVPQNRAKTLAHARVSLKRVFDDNIMTGPSSLIRRAAFERVGGYDGDIFLNCDLHWFYRIAAYFPIRFVDYVGVQKRIHALNNTAVNSHYEYGLKELEHIREHYPDVYKRIGTSVFNKKLARKYFRLGLYYEKRGELEKARKMYKQAMLLRKWSFRYSWEYCRSSAIASFRR
jgi:hypothetical protein